MLTGRLAFSTHKQQIYCILCHAQNQFSVSVAVAVAVEAYQHTLLISCVQSFQVLVFWPAIRVQLWLGARERAVVLVVVGVLCSAALLSQRQKLPMTSSRWCCWGWCRCPKAGNISAPAEKQESRERGSEGVQLELLLLIRQLLLLTKINLIEFNSFCFYFPFQLRLLCQSTYDFLRIFHVIFAHKYCSDDSANCSLTFCANISHNF